MTNHARFDNALKALLAKMMDPNTPCRLGVPETWGGSEKNPLDSDMDRFGAGVPAKDGAIDPTVSPRVWALANCAAAAGVNFRFGFGIGCTVQNRLTGENEIRLPYSYNFIDPLLYQHVSTHEMSHWIGNHLGDRASHGFGPAGQIMEEAIAEMCAGLVLSVLDHDHLDQNLSDCAGYLANWFGPNSPVRGDFFGSFMPAPEVLFDWASKVAVKRAHALLTMLEAYEAAHVAERMAA